MTAETKRLARELGRALGWDARQPSLCDLIPVARDLRDEAEKYRAALVVARALIRAGMEKAPTLQLWHVINNALDDKTESAQDSSEAK